MKEFAPIRAMMNVVGRLAGIKAEDRRRDLAAEREQQQRQGRGGYGRGR